MNRSCRICGAIAYSPSYGGPDICPNCDCGTPQVTTEYATLAASHQRLKEALRSFVFEFGDKTNSATVNKAREALEQAP